METSTCPKCGKQLPAPTNVCSSCGKRIDRDRHRHPNRTELRGCLSSLMTLLIPSAGLVYYGSHVLS